MDEPTVLTERHDRVGLVTLNRPRQMNALNDALMDALGVALLEFDRDPDIGAIVIAGSEKAFAAGGTQHLPRAIGKAKAMDLCLSGRTMNADETERSGLVSRVVPAAALRDESLALAQTLAGYSAPALMAIKEVGQPGVRGLADRGGASCTAASPAKTPMRACMRSSTSARRSSSTAEPRPVQHT